MGEGDKPSRHKSLGDILDLNYDRSSNASRLRAKQVAKNGSEWVQETSVRIHTQGRKWPGPGRWLWNVKGR